MKISPNLNKLLVLSTLIIFGACSKSKSVNQANYNDVNFAFKPGIGGSGGQALNIANNGQNAAAQKQNAPAKKAKSHEEIIKLNPFGLSDDLIDRKIELYNKMIAGSIKRSDMNQLIQDIHYERQNNVLKKKNIVSLSKIEQATEILNAFSYFDSASLKGIPFIHGLKVQIEDNLSKKHSENSKYRLSASSQWDWINDNRMQCSSGTKMLQNAWIRKNITDYSLANPVAIFSPAHVQLGYITEYLGRFYLYAIESTTSGFSQELLGPTDELFKVEEKGPTQYRVVDADYFMLANIFQYDMDEDQALWFRDSIVEATAKEFNIVYSNNYPKELKFANAEKAKHAQGKTTPVSDFSWPPQKQLLNHSLFSVPGDLSDIKDEDMDREKMDTRSQSDAVSDPGPQQIDQDKDSDLVKQEIEEEKIEKEKEKIKQLEQQEKLKGNVKDLSKISAEFFSFNGGINSNLFTSTNHKGKAEYIVSFEVEKVGYSGTFFENPFDEHNEEEMEREFNRQVDEIPTAFVSAEVILKITATKDSKTYTFTQELVVSMPHTSNFYQYLDGKASLRTPTPRFNDHRMAVFRNRNSSKEDKHIHMFFDAGSTNLGGHRNHPAVFLDIRRLENPNNLDIRELTRRKTPFLVNSNFYKTILKMIYTNPNFKTRFTKDVEGIPVKVN